MSKLIPEQMRALAASFVHESDAEGLARQRTEFRTALRVAADQIEAVFEQAAQVAESDAIGVTLVDLSQFPVVRATGARIAFNIRAAAQKSDAL